MSYIVKYGGLNIIKNEEQNNDSKNETLPNNILESNNAQSRKW